MSTGRQEMQWRFVSQAAWIAGDYRLALDTGIEDLAGNRVGQLFEIDVFEHVTQHIETKTIAFAVRHPIMRRYRLCRTYMSFRARIVC